MLDHTAHLMDLFEVILETPKEYVGQVKGMRQILQERGFFIPGMTKDGSKDRNKSMSMAYVLGEQSGFRVIEWSPQILAERLGGHCLILPKYHCELNPIEMVWGRAKHYVQGHPDYTLPGMRANIPVSLKEEGGLSRVMVEGFFRMSIAYHLIYSNERGMECTKLDGVYKTFKSHRRPTPSEYLI
ncbi:unnamed protein product [Choristocarpus tenellus]